MLAKFPLIDKKLHEIKNEKLRDYTGDFEMVGELSIGDLFRQTHIIFRNNTDYEHYIKIIGQEYESEDAIFDGYNYKLNTPQINLVNRSQYGYACDFKQQNIEYRGKKCYIPSNSYCFVTCNSFSTGKDYKQEYLDFIRIEDRRNIVKTMAHFQPCLRKLGFFLGYYNAKEIWLRNITERNRAFISHYIHFCLIWISEVVSFIKFVEYLEKIF